MNAARQNVECLDLKSYCLDMQCLVSIRGFLSGMVVIHIALPVNENGIGLFGTLCRVFRTKAHKINQHFKTSRVERILATRRKESPET